MYSNGKVKHSAVNKSVSISGSQYSGSAFSGGGGAYPREVCDCAGNTQRDVLQGSKSGMELGHDLGHGSYVPKLGIIDWFRNLTGSVTYSAASAPVSTSESQHYSGNENDFKRWGAKERCNNFIDKLLYGSKEFEKVNGAQYSHSGELESNRILLCDSVPTELSDVSLSCRGNGGKARWKLY